jgi:hypothetical protein
MGEDTDVTVVKCCAPSQRITAAKICRDVLRNSTDSSRVCDGDGTCEKISLSYEPSCLKNGLAKARARIVKSVFSNGTVQGNMSTVIRVTRDRCYDF